MNTITPKRSEIIRRRKELGLYQKEVAEAAGLSESYITRIETGSAKSPTLQVIASIALALQCRPADIADGIKAAILGNIGQTKEPQNSDIFTRLRNWIAHKHNVRNILIIAIRCGYKGLQPIDVWLREDAAEADREDILTIATTAGFKCNAGTSAKTAPCAKIEACASTDAKNA